MNMDQLIGEKKLKKKQKTIQYKDKKDTKEVTWS